MDVRKSLSAAGFTDWIPVDYIQAAFAIGVFVELSSGASLTYTVQHTPDNIRDSSRQDSSISRTTTIATVTRTNHRLSVGDSIDVRGSGAPNLDGNFSVASVVDANTYTYTVANTGATSATARILALRVFPHATLVSLTARADGNYAFPVRAVRLLVTAYASGSADIVLTQGMQR